MKKKIFIAVSLLCVLLVIVLSTLTAADERIEKDKILEVSQEWKDNYLKYQVDENLMDTLKAKIGDNLSIDVYLGTWCSDSQNNVPVFIKIIDSLKQENLPVNYFNVERKPNREIKYFVEKMKVERVPTFIFYRNGEEIGRIVENPKNSIIEDFIEIL